jgi:DHA1 family bicyclomycin/chloramphenicol resistance-like MFS transporter
MPSAATSFGLTVLLGVLIALPPLGTDPYVPALPAIAAGFDATARAAQLTLTTFFVGLAVGQLAWGPLSDRYGRKPMLLAGIAIYFATALAGAWASSIDALVWLRLAQGLGMSSGPVIARSIVRDLHSHEQAARLLAHMTIVLTVAPIAGPLVGAQILALWGWQAVFALMAAIAVVLLAAVAGTLHETAPANRAARGVRDIAHAFAAVLGEPRFRAPFTVLLCAQVGLFAFISNSAFVLMQGAGVTPAFYSVLFATVMLGQISGAWMSSRLVFRHGIGRMVRLGAALAGVAGVAAAAFTWIGWTHWLAVVAPFMLYFFATTLVTPNATAAALSPFPKAAGAASSLIGAAQFTMGAIVSSVLGALFDGTPRAMALTAALGGLSALAVEIWLVRPALRPRSAS